MKLKVFTLRIDPETGRFDDPEMETFLAEREVISVTEHFFVEEGAPVWALLVTWREPAGSGEPRQRNRKDWRATLAPDEADLFDALRVWRNDRARREGKPAYILLNNRQLAAVAQARPVTDSALRAIEGIGDARIRNLADDILAVVARLNAEAEAPSATEKSGKAKVPAASAEPREQATDDATKP